MTGGRISVVIPTRDRPQLAAAAVRSVLAGLPDDAEVLIVDDGSAPEALTALAQAVAGDNRLRLIRNDGPHGAAAARNFGVGAAAGRWIFFLDDDDLMVPGYPAAVLAALAVQPGRWGFAPVLQHAAGAAPELPPAAGLALAPLPPPFGKRHLSGLGTGFWIERELFLSAGGIWPELRVNEDTEFCIRLLTLGAAPLIANRPGVSLLTGNAGVAGQAASVTRGAPAADRAHYFGQIIDRHKGFLKQNKVLREWLGARQMKYLVRSRQYRQAASLAAGLGPKGWLRYFGYRLLGR